MKKREGTRDEDQPARQAGHKVRIGIKLKLLGILLPIVIGMILLIVIQVYASTKKIVLEKSESILLTSTESVIHEVETWMMQTRTALTMERDTIEYYDMNEAAMLDYVKHTADRYDSFPAGIYVALDDGKLIHASFAPGPEFNVFEKPWYQEGIKSDEFIYGSVYFDEDSQSYVVGASGALRDKNGNKKGVAAADIYLSAISVIVESVKLEETGKMFLVDTNTNMIIGHPDAAMVGKKLDELDNEFYSYISSRSAAGDMGLNKLALQTGDELYTDIQRVPDSAWITVAYVPEAEILAELDQLTARIGVIAAIGCIIVILFMERVIHLIIKPVKKLSGTIASITEGDFTVDVPVKTSDEIGFMAEGVKKFITTMRNSMRQIHLVSDTLNTQAADSQKMSEELSEAAKGQAVSMDEMARTISELTRSITEVAENATSLALLVSDTKEKGDIAGEQMREAVTASDSGREDMGRVLGSMSQIAKKMQSLEECSLQMEESIEKINAIVGMIGEIAEETNLLSLNASIEAARAGEAGRGFAVVAGQIGKLAATSKESVEKISGLTNEISGIVTKTVRETGESVTAIKESTDMVQIAEKTFAEIYDAVNQTNEAVNNMIDCVREVNEIAVSVAGITEEQSAASEEILATTETVNESTRQVSDNSREVEESAEQMDENAKLLGKELGRFKV